MITHQYDYIDHEYHHVFICPFKQNINSLIIQKEEVTTVQLFPLEQLSNLTNEFVPYSDEYINKLFIKLGS